MKQHHALVLGLVAVGVLTGGQCSRARVESMNHMNEGIVYAQQQRHLDAVESLERAAAVDPTNDQAFYNLALVHIEMRKFARAKEDLNRAIAANGEVAGYHEKLGTVLSELDENERAKEAFEKAIELDSELFKAYFKLARVLERLDDQQNALTRYTEAIQAGPRFIPAYSELGRLYADLGYLDQAAQVLQEGLKVAIPGTDEQAQLHYLLGTVYQQQRKFEESIAEFREALDISPGMREALFSLGWTYALTGNKEDGRRYLKKFVDVAGGEAPEHYVKAARDRIAELGEGP
ncbi:MAG: tetratricopeptide repeat protein [Myxococcota bacterium]